MSLSYATLAAKQVREGPPAAPAPTLDELTSERDLILSMREDYRRAIRNTRHDLSRGDYPPAMRETINRQVGGWCRQLAVLDGRLVELTGEINALRVLLYGWMNCPSEAEDVP